MMFISIVLLLSWTPKTLKLFYFRSSHRRCSEKKVFLEISQNLQENTCARDYFLIKLQAFLLKKSLRQRCFSVNFAKFLRITFLQNNSGWLLLLFHDVKFLRFLDWEILFILCHWKHYVLMEFEYLSVFLIGKALPL